MRIYIDIDSTLNDHWKRIARWVENIPKYQVMSGLKFIFTREEVMQDKPLEGAVEAVKLMERVIWQGDSSLTWHLIRQFDNEIVYLTARGWDKDGLITREWLRANGFPDHELIIVDSAKDKLGVLARRPGLLIDDMSRNQHIHGKSYVGLYDDIIAEMKRLSMPLILFKGDWSQTMEEVREHLASR